MQNPESIWVVVEVHSGIPIGVEAYRDRKLAEQREHFVRARMHPEYGEAGIFEVQLENIVPDLSLPPQPSAG